ncbi:exonuclease domain-containing protein [Nonomuraea sp. NPDC050394]|uniref:3'-5' exonuclease n=1 Tax=Nonomuraea sp. NPDC050394 TaxID=3364363 RepID=UPI00379C3D07
MSPPWTTADNLIALDLEGIGGQDRDREKILEIAVVPLTGGQPDMAQAWETTINPGRTIAPRSWISPDLTGTILLTAPPLEDVADNITTRVHKRILVGHNLAVDWRLLHRDLPDPEVVALIDTARLYNHLRPQAERWSLSRLITQYGLTDQMHALAPKRSPHRALWDAVAAALLLPALVGKLPRGSAASAAELERVASLPSRPPSASERPLQPKRAPRTSSSTGPGLSTVRTAQHAGDLAAREAGLRKQQ